MNICDIKQRSTQMCFILLDMNCLSFEIASLTEQVISFTASPLQLPIDGISYKEPGFGHQILLRFYEKIFQCLIYETISLKYSTFNHFPPCSKNKLNCHWSFQQFNIYFTTLSSIFLNFSLQLISISRIIFLLYASFASLVVFCCTAAAMSYAIAVLTDRQIR